MCLYKGSFPQEASVMLSRCSPQTSHPRPLSLSWSSCNQHLSCTYDRGLTPFLYGHRAGQQSQCLPHCLPVPWRKFLMMEFTLLQELAWQWTVGLISAGTSFHFKKIRLTPRSQEEKEGRSGERRSHSGSRVLRRVVISHEYSRCRSVPIISLLGINSPSVPSSLMGWSGAFFIKDADFYFYPSF